MRILLLLFFFSASVFGQNVQFDRRQLNNIDDVDKIAPSWWPHPYTTAALSLMPSGYAPAAAYGEVGLELERSPWLGNASVGYDNGHKTSDGDQPNPNGHDRYLSFSARRRLWHYTNWFVGGGWEWSQLSTTNYTKGGSRPFFGGGYDLYFDHQGTDPESRIWSMRFTLDYFTPGTDWQNSSHGFKFGLTMPRPIEKRHVFFVENIVIYRSNETVTEPDNLQLTREQKADKFNSGSTSLGIMFRFH